MKIFILSTLLIFLSACASTNGTKVTSLKKSNPNAELNSRVFAEGLQSKWLKQTSKSRCPSKFPTEIRTWKSLAHSINSCLKVNKTHMAGKLIQKMIAVNPDSPWGAYYLSVIAQMKNKSEKALWLIDLSLRKANRIGLLHYQKARIQWQMKDKAAATNSLLSALKLNSDLVGAHIQLSQIYHAQGNFKASQKHYNAALILEPNIKSLRSLAGIKQKIQKEALSARTPARAKGRKQ